MKRKTILISSIIVLLIIGVFLLLNRGSNEEITFTHVHGIGYSSNGKILYVAAHDGLREYKNGKWKISKSEKNDYMGFSITKDGFYSSGHPGEGSKLKNPLGLVKSEDHGKNIEVIDFHGEVDFHGLIVGYETNVLYVYNPTPNKKMPEVGIYYSLDESKTWKKSKLKNVKGTISSLAAHPTNKNILAVATDNGVFFSEDNGNSVTSLIPSIKATALTFTRDNHLLVSYMDKQTKFLSINLNTKQTTDINLPNLNDGIIFYIEQNPIKENEFALGTHQNSIYITKDKGKTWTIIVENGNKK